MQKNNNKKMKFLEWFEGLESKNALQSRKCLNKPSRQWKLAQSLGMF